MYRLNIKVTDPTGNTGEILRFSDNSSEYAHTLREVKRELCADRLVCDSATIKVYKKEYKQYRGYDWCLYDSFYLGSSNKRFVRF